MTAPTIHVVNQALIRAVLGQIKRAPVKWDQTVWWSTEAHAGCFAAWALKISGRNPVRVLAADRPGYPNTFRVARLLLGLDESQATRLFHYIEDAGKHPTLAQLRQRLTDVTGVGF